MGGINPLQDGFINYSRLKNECLLNEILSTKINKEGNEKWMCNKKRFIDMEYFKKIRICILYYNNDEYEFEFPLMADPDKLFIKFENSIVYREVSRFLTNSRIVRRCCSIPLPRGLFVCVRKSCWQCHG